MAITLSSSRESFLFAISGTSAHLSVVAFTVSEKISCYFSSQVALAATSEIKTFDDIIGKEALLTVINNDRLSGSDRYFHGVVRRIECFVRSCVNI
ncbi:MAG: hypothetical protein LLG05_08760 [Porphyromonadaceae bacterium]|nr:hypothetical protein [Porphyromonadaceae bacterium]